MNSELLRWLRNWRNNLSEVVIAAGTAGSAVTSFMGARKLVNENYMVAVLLTIFFQGGLFVVAHLATDRSRSNHRPRKVVLSVTWLLLAVFSIYSSAIGAFELVKDSLTKDHTYGAVVAQWQAAEKDISEFKTKALSWVTDAKRDAEQKMNFERERKRVAERRNRYYSSNKLQLLAMRFEALKEAQTKVQEVQMSGNPPASSESARKALDGVFLSVKAAYTSLPEEARVQFTEPRRTIREGSPDDLQKAFWAEVQHRSAPALVILLVAALMDVLPALLRYASRSKKTLAEKIHGTRQAGRDIWNALVEPLSPITTAVRIVAVGHPDLDITLNFASGHRQITLSDVSGDLAVVMNEVAAKIGHAVRIRSVMTSSQMEVVPDLPLLDQLDDDLTLHLQFET